MSKPSVVGNHESQPTVTYASYIVGFSVSVVLTLLAFLTVTQHWLNGYAALAVVVVLALLQFCVQLLCFLHLSSETNPRPKLQAFVFMLVVVFILVAGSIWIMNNLSYHMQPTHINQYLHDQDRL